MPKDICIDLSYLRSISMDDESLIEEMIVLFLENAPKMMHNIETHYANKDLQKMASEIHRFKPNLDYMGMTETKKIIEKIEAEAKAGNNTERMQQHLQIVNQQCSHAYTQLKEIQSKTD